MHRSSPVNLSTSRPFSNTETVEIRRSQPHRGIARGMVGKVIARFGAPATHYCVAVAQADSFGYFAARDLRPPRRDPRCPDAPDKRAAAKFACAL